MASPFRNPKTTCMFNLIKNLISNISPVSPFRKRENKVFRAFQNKGIKIFILFLFFSVFVHSPSSVSAGNAEWEGLIAPYCTGTGLDEYKHEVKDGSCTLCDGIRMAKGFLDFLAFNLSLPLAMLAVLIAGVEYTLAGADAALVGKAIKLLTNTAKGLAYIFCAWLIINTILAGFGISGIQGAWNPGSWFVIKCM